MKQKEINKRHGRGYIRDRPKMKKEFNLSDFVVNSRVYKPKVKVVHVKDIKKAVRLLKEEMGCGRNITIISSFKEEWHLKCGEEFTDRTDKDRKKYYCDNCKRMLKEINKIFGDKLI